MQIDKIKSSNELNKEDLDKMQKILKILEEKSIEAEEGI